MKSCVQCSIQFEVTDQDRVFYTKMNIPEPTLCPQCRRQRRMAFRNERNLYKRKCDLTGQQIISCYSSDKPFIIYNYKDWLSDKWDPLDYGKEFDFNRPFFEQFEQLQYSVPKRNLFIEEGMENCDYCNYGGISKDCYLCFAPYKSEKCLYSYPVWCTEDVDGYMSIACQHCYECFYCENCYETSHCDHSKNCHNSHFLLDCIGCENCFGCVNLHHKKYYFLNQPLSKTEFEQKVTEITASYQATQKFLDEFQKFLLQYPRKALRSYDLENSSGDLLRKSKNCMECFDTLDLQDSKYCNLSGLQSSDLYDCYLTGEGAVECYENIGSLGNNHVLFQIYTQHNSNCYYCISCQHCEHCFGCEGLRHKKYCILNKQYSKEEYEKLLPKIIEHMKKVPLNKGDLGGSFADAVKTPLSPPLSGGRSSEWGEFFPIEISPFAYNETVAHDDFLLTKEEILKKGWKWKDEEEPDFSNGVKKIPAQKLPDTIVEVPDDVLNCKRTP